MALIRNEKLQFVEISNYTNEILLEGLGHNTVSEQDAKNALAELYVENSKLQSQKFFNNNFKGAQATVTVQSLNLDKLWDDLKDIFCSIAKEDSIFTKIIDFILEAISSIVPLGILIKALVKIIIKFFLQEGVKLICPIKT